MLEQSTYLSGFNIHVNAAESRVGACARHQANGAGAGAQKLGAGVDQYVPDGQRPTLGRTLDCRVGAQAEMGFNHHGCKVVVLGIVLEHLGLGFCFGGPGGTVASTFFHIFRKTPEAGN